MSLEISPLLLAAQILLQTHNLQEDNSEVFLVISLYIFRQQIDNITSTSVINTKMNLERCSVSIS